MDTVFKFMTLVSPEPVDPDDNKHIKIENPGSDLQKKLKVDYAHPENPRDEMVRHAREFMESDKFVGDLGSCSTPFLEFGKFLAREESLDMKVLRATIQAVFRTDVNDLVGSTQYIQDRQNMGDSLIALTITNEGDANDCARLSMALLLAGLFERVAAQDATLDRKGGIECALNETIVLPGSIFPLPRARHERPVGRERREEIEQVKEEAREAEEAAQRLKDLRMAIDELTAVKAADFRMAETPRKASEATVEDKGPVTAPLQSPWILSEEAVSRRLSRSTIKEIDNLGIPLDTTPLPEIVQTMEAKLIDICAQLCKAEKPTRMMKLGSSFLPVHKILGEAVSRNPTAEGGA